MSEKMVGVKIKFSIANGNYRVEQENLCVPLCFTMAEKHFYIFFSTYPLK